MSNSGVFIRCLSAFVPEDGSGENGCDVDELIGLSDLVCGVDYLNFTINCGVLGHTMRACACTVHAYVHVITAKCCFTVIV